MSWRKRRGFVGLALAGLLGGCGFQPLYGPDSSARDLDGRVAVAMIDGEMGFAFRERLTSNLGQATAATHEVVTELDVNQQGLAISDESNITRYNLTGLATYSVVSLGDRTTVSSGTARAFAAYSATASPVATRAAERDAHVRLARSLAEQVALEIAADAPVWLP